MFIMFGRFAGKKNATSYEYVTGGQSLARLITSAVVCIEHTFQALPAPEADKV